MKKTGIKMRIVTPYYPEAQVMIERGHKEIKDPLIKMCEKMVASGKIISHL